MATTHYPSALRRYASNPETQSQPNRCSLRVTPTGYDDQIAVRLRPGLPLGIALHFGVSSILNGSKQPLSLVELDTGCHQSVGQCPQDRLFRKPAVVSGYVVCMVCVCRRRSSDILGQFDKPEFLDHSNHQGEEMRRKSGPRKSHDENVVKHIRRATGNQYSSEEKTRIVRNALKGDDSIAELRRLEGIAQTRVAIR